MLLIIGNPDKVSSNTLRIGVLEFDSKLLICFEDGRKNRVIEDST